MNRTKIEWAEYTWNPVTGCMEGCPYCYAESLSRRFCGDVRRNLTDPQCNEWQGEMLLVLDEPFKNEKGNIVNMPFGFNPTLHRYRLDWMKGLKNGANIFVCSMADLFGPWVPDGCIEEVFAACRRYPIHNYLFLTKNPARYDKLHEAGKLPGGDNFWYGSTVTRPGEPFFQHKEYKTFVSVEPMLAPFPAGVTKNIAENSDWIILGAETGKRKEKVLPAEKWISDFAFDAYVYGPPVFMKDNLAQVMKTLLPKQEFPFELQRKEISEKLKKKLWDRCCVCKTEQPMKNMVALLTRECRGQHPSQWRYVCPGCKGVLDKVFDSDMPLNVREREG